MHVTYLPSYSFFPLFSLVEIFSLRFLSCCWPGIFECTLFICTPPHAISFIPLTHHTEHFLLFHLSYRSASIIPLSPTLLHASLASRPHPSPPLSSLIHLVVVHSPLFQHANNTYYIYHSRTLLLCYFVRLSTLPFLLAIFIRARSV